MQIVTQNKNQNIPYFNVAQQVLRMEWEGGHAANPNPERTSTQNFPRIDQWWLAGRPMNEKSHNILSST